MFLEHTGLRSLWPAMLLLPWFFVGIAYLLGAILGRKEPEPASLAWSIGKNARHR